jgi:hypothetical protein
MRGGRMIMQSEGMVLKGNKTNFINFLGEAETVKLQSGHS